MNTQQDFCVGPYFIMYILLCLTDGCTSPALQFWMQIKQRPVRKNPEHSSPVAETKRKQWDFVTECKNRKIFSSFIILAGKKILFLWVQTKQRPRYFDISTSNNSKKFSSDLIARFHAWLLSIDDFIVTFHLGNRAETSNMNRKRN